MLIQRCFAAFGCASMLAALPAQAEVPAAKPSLFDDQGRVLGAPDGLHGVGGRWGGRVNGRRRLQGRMRGLARAIDLGLTWLRRHQDADGGWNAAAFMRHERGTKSDAPGEGIGRAGITGFCLLAFLGDGTTLVRGPDVAVVRRGVEFLRRQQKASGAYAKSLFEHAVATYAVCEAAGLSRSTVLRGEATAALRYLVSKQAKDGGFDSWGRLDRSDAWTTIHGLLAYKTGYDFRFVSGKAPLRAGGQWLDRVDPQQLAFPVLGGHPLARGQRSRETVLSAALLGSFFLGRNPKRYPAMSDLAGTIAKRPPAVEGRVGDPSFSYLATYGLYQMGGAYWARWSRPMAKRLVLSQREDGNFAGSFDPRTPGAVFGGRLYATVLAVLTAQSYYRYTRLVR